jgi:hypothetical protein
MQTSVVAVRLPPTLCAKLADFCVLSGRTPSEVLRALLAMAEVTALPRSWTALTASERAILADVERRPGPRPRILMHLPSGLDSGTAATESKNA